MKLNNSFENKVKVSNYTVRKFKKFCASREKCLEFVSLEDAILIQHYSNGTPQLRARIDICNQSPLRSAANTRQALPQ